MTTKTDATIEVSCLAVIPARGGSKRVPGKNVREFCGKPMIAHTIEAAIQCGLFASVIVSTDDRGIAALSQRYGAETPFIRNPELADDYTPVSLVTLDALSKHDPERSRFGFVAQLMPNCPLRTAEDIRNSFSQFVRTRAEVQISVTRYGWQNPWWAMTRNDGYGLLPLFTDAVRTRSQDLPPVYCPTGAVWWIRAETLHREETFHIQGRTGWEIPWKRGIDIDTEEDWEMAVMLGENTCRT
jgi:CMP-N-acetylneuraminic acid synthetase